MSDEFDPRRKTPPEKHEWPDIWETLDHAKKTWRYSGPIHAVASNWKALCVIAGIVAWLNGPEITAMIKILLGVAP